MGELVGAGGVVSANNALQKFFYLVDVFTFYKSCNALQIAVTAADKFKIMYKPVVIDVENYLSRTRSRSKVSKHFILLIA